MTEKEDGILHTFVLEFAEALATEYNFMVNVSQGFANNRPDAVERHMKELFTVVNLTVSTTPFINGLVSVITDQVGQLMQNRNNLQTEKKMSEMTKHSPEERTMLFNQIALEVMYRYGTCIYFYSTQLGPENSRLLLSRLARTGAIRIVYHALKLGIGFENCEKLVKGLMDGFDGFREHDMLTKLCEGVLNFNGKPVLSCEGLYTRTGFMTPGNQFWIHADLDRQTGKNGRIGGYVTFVKPADKGLFRENRVVPKYGYLAAPNGQEPQTCGFRKHKPLPADNVHVSLGHKMRYRFVALDHIVKYLAEIKAASSTSSRPDFNSWLVKSFPGEFSMPAGFKVKALFRGELSASHFTFRKVDFELGKFDDVDFSYTMFKDLTLPNMQKARLIGCSFINCSATGNVLSGANLSLSTADKCKFEGLHGMLTLNYTKLTETSLFASVFTLSTAIGLNMDNFTLESLNPPAGGTTSTTISAADAAASKKLYDIYLEMQIKGALADAEFKRIQEAQKQEEIDRQSNRNLLNSLMEKTAQKEIEQERRHKAERDKWKDFMDKPLDAWDKGTMDSSIKMIQRPAVSETHIMSRVFEALFFMKPVQLLRQLERHGDIIKWATLPRAFNYGTDGVDGEHGEDGVNGSPGSYGGGSGGSGTDGQDAQNGTDATANTVCIMSVPNQRIFVVSPNAADREAAIMPLFDGRVRIDLSAKGGDGGNGGHGGRGGHGGEGLSGRNATASAAGTSGTPGGVGGNGGNGGRAGDAGKSADITVLVKEEDMDLLSLLRDLHNPAGKGGLRGNFGLGGNGGDGGEGGCGYSGYDGERHFSNPGGRHGPGGAAGRNGNDGKPGRDSKPGNTVFTVVDTTTGEVNTYTTMYNLEMSSIQPFSSVTGIIEPGQRVQVPSFVVVNKGGMPTPATEMIITLERNTYIVTTDDSCWKTHEKFWPNRNFTVSDPRFFTVAENLRPPSMDQALCLPTHLRITAKFPRTMVEFADFQKPKIPLTVMHPLEISLVTGARATVYDCAVPIIITVRNKGRVAYGLGAAYTRLVRVNVALDESEHGSIVKDAVFATTPTGLGDRRTPYSLCSEVSYDIDFIAGRSEMVLSGTILLTPKQASLYDQVKLTYSLSLGDVANPVQQSAMEVIQTKSHTLQVAEYCTPITSTDCMLIVSGTTTATEVENWRKAFKNIGHTMCVFNVSVYHGASYKFPAFNICAELSNRLVVILNSPFQRDDDVSLLSKTFYPLDYLEQSEMFEAARRHNVRTLVVNYSGPTDATPIHHRNFADYIVPMAAFDVPFEQMDAVAVDGRRPMYEQLRGCAQGRDEDLPESYQYCRIKLFRMLCVPKERDFDNRIKAMSKRLTTVRPDRTYYAAKVYKPATKGLCKYLVFSRYDIGHVEVRRGLDTTYAVMASTVVSQGEPALPSHTEFVLLKLLSLNSKLMMLASEVPNSPAFLRIATAIISDIADEQAVFLARAREKFVMWDYRKLRLQGWLMGLSTLESFDFSDIVRVEGGVPALMDMLLKLCGMASQYNKSHMLKSNFMAKGVLDTCFSVMKKHLNVLTEEEFKKKVSEFNLTESSSCKDAEVVEKMRDPFNCRNEVTFNHWAPRPDNILVGTQTLKATPTLSLMRNKLPDLSAEGAYKKAVSFFSQAPVYHIQALPNLYAVPPGVTVLPEPASAKPSYSARGDLATM